MTDRANHLIQDASLNRTKALPAAGASASTDVLDLGLMSARGARLEDVEFELHLPATPDLVDAKTILIDVMHDVAVGFGSEAALFEDLISVVGAGGTGAAAQTKRFKLPSTTNRYLRATATVLAAGGDNTAVSFTLKPLF